MKSQPGFTAVEVLVTLIIAFLLVSGAYQAYSVVIQNTEQASSRSVASNIAYENLRKQAATVGATCTVRPPVYHSTAGIPLLNPYLTTYVTCPFGTSNSMSLVTTTLKYGYVPDQKEVTHALLTSSN